jgi:Zn-dependent peptidase ImmA (M78 family)/DNA-binding XRE family transcriptional regulator
MNGERLRQARELCGFTQQELAEGTGVAQSAIAQIEAGQFTPTLPVAQSLAIRTGFDLSFLKNTEPPLEFPVGSLLYRGKAKVSPKDKARAHRFAQFLFELVRRFQESFRHVPITLPRLGDETPAEAARMARSHFGLSPDTPIANVTSLLERAGVLVLRIPLEVEGLDGFSVWAGRDKDTPIICLVGTGVGYRDRYTLTEEVGHLIMHSPLRCTVEQAEREVKGFIGEFVLPADAMLREMRTPITLAGLSPLKPRWGASIQFLAARSKELEMTTPNQYRYLMQQVSSRGWRTRKREPGDELIPQEKPQLLRRMAESLYGSPPDVKRMRRDIGIPQWLLGSILAAHGIVGARPPSNVLQMNPR